MTQHELLGKFLTRLELSRLLVRPPAWNTRLLTEIGQPLVLDEVTFLSCHTQLNMISTHPLNQAMQPVDVDTLCQRLNGITAWKAIQLCVHG